MIQIENVILPNKPLSNIEIEDVVKKIGLKNFPGVFLRDTLPKEPKRNECVIKNPDDTSGDGMHLVGWFKRGDKKWYFDSFALPPPTELSNYLGDVFYPTEQIQPRQAVICGHLCLFVLKEMKKGKHLQEIINLFW